MPNTDERLSRSHIIHAERANQIGLNRLALAGGRPYIDARLARLPYESDTSWTGAGREGGRASRAFLINYAARIAAKINQYVFSTEVQRPNADPRFLADTTRTGMTITALMAHVSELVTAARWCWISVDRNSLPRDAQGQPVRRSVAAKEASGDRVFWTVWAPNEVVDWHFDQSGKLIWVITEQSVYDNSDFTKPAGSRQVRTIWQKGGGVRLWLNEKNREKIDLEEPFTTTLDDVGFVPVGTPSATPWWFDDVERVLAALLNLDSVHGENLYQTVFPQLVLPDGMLQTVMDALKISGDYDGDGKQDLMLYHETTGTWIMRLSAAGYALVRVKGFGGSGYVPVPGDFDGDGLADLVIYETATSAWTFRLSSMGYAPLTVVF